MKSLEIPARNLGDAPEGQSVLVVADTTALAAVITTFLSDGTVANLGDGTQYKFNATAVSGGITPTIGNGQWIPSKVTYVNAKDFGATGDGVTDDLVALQKAVAALNATSNLGSYTPDPVKTLYIPAGIYALSNRLVIQGDNIRVIGDGWFSTRIKYTGNAIINEVVKFLNAQYCELSNIGIDGGLPYNPLLTETYGAKACLALDLTPFFTCKNVYLANSRLQGLRCIHVWESYFENLQIRNSGYFSDGTLAGCGAGIHFSNDAAQKESSNALGAGFESNNTVFYKCTLVPVGCLVRCDAPTFNTTFNDPITENRDFAAFFYALGESKWYINSATNFVVEGGYCYGHEHSFACSAKLFEIVAQFPGVRIKNYSWLVNNPTGGYFPEITTGFNIDPAYPVSVENFVIDDMQGVLVAPLTISVNGPRVIGDITYKSPALPDASTLFSTTSLQRFNGKVFVYNSAANTNQSYDYSETEKRYDYLAGAGVIERFAARAWVVFNGTTGAVLASKNVTGPVVRNSAGNYTVNLTNGMPDANYCAIANGNASSAADDRAFVGGQTQTQVNVVNGSGGVQRDATVISLVIFR